MVDGVAATADVLEAVVHEVGGRAEVYVDGGIRNGADVVKAVAMGARAALTGRPVLWGLAVAGADGAAHALITLADQFAKAMAFCGASRVDDLTPDLVQTAEVT
jgi:isopentenyl diphosphate isomerase/L-lactate dehydrogenase-like FMN-dependent dehydrogenase